MHRRKAGLNCPFFFPVAIAEPKIQPAPVVAARRASKKIQELAPYVDVDAPVPSLSRSKGRKQIASAAVLIEEVS